MTTIQPTRTQPTRTRRLLGATTSVGLVLGLVMIPSASAVADDNSSVNVTNTETVQAYLTPSGEVKDARIYEQLALQGQGEKTVANPVSDSGLRNLDGFGPCAQATASKTQRSRSTARRARAR